MANKRKKKIGRPKKRIDADQVEKLAMLHCSNSEIAAFFDVNRTTIQRRFASSLTKGREQGNMRLRQLQWKAAERGNISMLIFLGKQYLGQSDKTEQSMPEGIDVRIKYV